MAEKSENQDHDQDVDRVDQLKEQIKGLTRDLLNERITRIDFQVQLLTQWRRRCQQELNHLLANEEDGRAIEGAHG